MTGKVLLAVVIFSGSFVWGQTNATAPGQKPGLGHRPCEERSVGSKEQRRVNGTGKLHRLSVQKQVVSSPQGVFRSRP